MPALDLREAWADLLARRPAFRGALRPYGDILDAWAAAPPARSPLAWGPAQCRGRWERGVPLLAEAPPLAPDEDVETVLGAVMEVLAALDGARAPGLQRLADAWDRREVTPRHLAPAAGRDGDDTVARVSGLGADVVGFLACATLRPALEAYLGPCRQWLPEAAWAFGICPLCGAPPAFADVIEDGRRRLACHCCGGDWVFARGQCPFCGVEGFGQAVRLEPGDAEAGYLIVACRHCRAYMKELDRRVRWNGGPALIEDWGSPHFDLVAHRAGYRRAVPTLVPPGQG